jgi:hypothetical protein
MSQALINAIQQARKETSTLELKVAELEKRIATLESRKKPGPKPKNG